MLILIVSALERMVRESRGNTRVSAGVYGANTAGAVTGTLASAFLLLPGFGLSGTPERNEYPVGGNNSPVLPAELLSAPPLP
jgi:hypothetical protein